MKETENIKSALNRKFKNVLETPASFPFFVALHDFVKFVESTPRFEAFFNKTKKGNRASEISPRYSVMRQVYQGIEDLDVHTKTDLGHDRYITIQELNLIRKNDVSDSNTFWKRRELLRKLAGEIHNTLHNYLSEAEVKS